MSIVNKISSKIFYSIFIGALIVFSLYTTINYFYTKNTLANLTNNVVDRTFRSAYNRIETQVLPVIANARNSVFFINSSFPDTTFYLDLIKHNNPIFPGIYGSGIYVFTKPSKTTCSNYLFVEKTQTHKIISSPELNQKTNDTTGEYYDVAIAGDTISFKYYYTDTLKTIILLYDFRLSLFLNTINRETRHLQSRHYLFNKQTNAILSSKERNNTAGDNLKKTDLAELTSLIKQNKFGYSIDGQNNKHQAYYISKIRGTDLTLASVMQTDEIIKHIRRFYTLAFVLAIISFALLAYVLQRIIIGQTRPLLELSKIGRLIEKGKLHIEIPDYHTDRETEQLAKTLRTVQGRMQKYVSSLHSTLKEKRSLTKDLSLAEKIQTDMLPAPDRGINNIPGVDIYCKLKPARGVAGDFYDFFLVDDDNLFFVLGDVSGKSIPAALFMVKAITLIQVEARKGSDPGKIFTSVNEQLTFRNDEGMFVTAVCGIINTKTGDTLLCDAGHHAPLTNFNSVNYTYSELTKNLPLGILIGGRPYRFSTFKLKPGETIILYSDGLPEASDINGKMLGHEMIETELAGFGTKETDEIANKIWGLYNNFTRDATGNDDVSILILKFKSDTI